MIWVFKVHYDHWIEKELGDKSRNERGEELCELGKGKELMVEWLDSGCIFRGH